MNLGQTICHGVKWSFFGNTGTPVLHFAFGIVMARLLVPANFGAMATIHVFTGFVGLLAASNGGTLDSCTGNTMAEQVEPRRVKPGEALEVTTSLYQIGPRWRIP